MLLTEKRSRGTYFASRKQYVEDLSLALAPSQDFDSIKYARTYTTEEEYVRISDIIGRVCYLDITALPLSEVFKDVAKVMLIGDINCVPGSLIADKSKMREVAGLFR